MTFKTFKDICKQGSLTEFQAVDLSGLTEMEKSQGLKKLVDECHVHIIKHILATDCVLKSFILESPNLIPLVVSRGWVEILALLNFGENVGEILIKAIEFNKLNVIQFLHEQNCLNHDLKQEGLFNSISGQQVNFVEYFIKIGALVNEDRKNSVPGQNALVSALVTFYNNYNSFAPVNLAMYKITNLLIENKSFLNFDNEIVCQRFNQFVDTHLEKIFVELETNSTDLAEALGLFLDTFKNLIMCAGAKVDMIVGFQDKLLSNLSVHFPDIEKHITQWQSIYNYNNSKTTFSKSRFNLLQTQSLIAEKTENICQVLTY